MTKTIIAFATDDGETFVSRHFGDAKFYDIYEIEEGNSIFIKRISNSIDEEEEVHADPKKAKGISGLLLKEDVSIVVSRVFGPNIKRIRKKFVCIIIRENKIKDVINKIHANINTIHDEWEKGEERKHLSL